MQTSNEQASFSACHCLFFVDFPPELFFTCKKMNYTEKIFNVFSPARINIMCYKICFEKMWTITSREMRTIFALRLKSSLLLCLSLDSVYSEASMF